MPSENETYHPRMKDMSKESFNMYQGLSEQMKSFVDDYYATDFYKSTGNKFSLTSGKRDASQDIGKYSKTSKHNTGDAIDFSANNVDIFNFFKNNEEGIALAKKHNASFLDETDPAVMAKTGATGKHYHVQLNGNVVIHDDSEHEDNGNETQLSNDILENPYNFNQKVTQLYSDALDKEKEVQNKTEEQKELEQEQERIDKEISDANSFLKMYSQLGQDDDPMLSIKESNTTNNEVPLYAFQDLQLQRYNPNIFTVLNKNS